MNVIKGRENINQAIVEFLDKIAVIELWDPEDPSKPLGMTQKMKKAWASKTDGSFLCYKDHEYTIDFLFQNDISQDIQAIKEGGLERIGFSPSKQKWFGFTADKPFPWCKGFGIGDSVTRDDIGYRPRNEKEWKQLILDQWNNEEFAWSQLRGGADENNREGVVVTSGYGDHPPSELLTGAIIEKFFPFPDSYGRGEWTAETLDDAKQMAIDFAEDIS